MHEGSFENFVPLLPAPLIEVTRTPRGRGHRVRDRYQHKRMLVLEANEKLRGLNALDAGLNSGKIRTRDCSMARAAHDSNWRKAVHQLHDMVMKQAALSAQERLKEASCHLPGAQVTANLIKADKLDRYQMQRSDHSQIAIRAAHLDEPAPGLPRVYMLDALLCGRDSSMNTRLTSLT